MTYLALCVPARTGPSIYVFGSTDGQVYTRSGWTTSWTRLMVYCEKVATVRGITFERFTLADMRPTATTDRLDEGDEKITDATGNSERMVRKVYDRRREKKVRATRLAEG